MSQIGGFTQNGRSFPHHPLQFRHGELHEGVNITTATEDGTRELKNGRFHHSFDWLLVAKGRH